MTKIKLYTLALAVSCFVVASTLLRGSEHATLLLAAGTGLIGLALPEAGRRK